MGFVGDIVTFVGTLKIMNARAHSWDDGDVMENAVKHPVKSLPNAFFQKVLNFN